MSTITEPSAILQIQDKLKTLSPQELRMVENVIHDLQKNHAVSEHSEKENNDLDFDKYGWHHPKPEQIQEFLDSWAGCLAHLPDWDKKQIREMRLNERYG
ncbi:MAG: hypothetical protein LBG58_00850, partial [Planctomycetaceae bacterium]|nr:hypothetical protein [Planctomycetaceae bacterium]